MQPSGEIHPLAALLPMLADDELAELAADIGANGLQQPIVLDPGGVLLDGRNRLAACRLAGVEPRFVVSDGDPRAVIHASNLRRNISKGQWAMWLVESGGLRQTTLRELEERSGVSHSRIAFALVVKEYAPQLVEQVLAGGSLDQAYEHAQRAKRQLDDAVRLAEEAERRRQHAAVEAERALARLRLSQEQIGPAVPIPEPPELTQTVPVRGAPDGVAPRLDNIRVEQDYADRMAAIKDAVRQLAALPVVMDAMPALSVGAARSWASQVIRDIYAIVDAHNRQFEDGQGIRRVK